MSGFDTSVDFVEWGRVSLGNWRPSLPLGARAHGPFHPCSGRASPMPPEFPVAGGRDQPPAGSITQQLQLECPSGATLPANTNRLV